MRPAAVPSDVSQPGQAKAQARSRARSQTSNTSHRFPPLSRQLESTHKSIFLTLCFLVCDELDNALSLLLIRSDVLPVVFNPNLQFFFLQLGQLNVPSEGGGLKSLSLQLGAARTCSPSFISSTCLSCLSVNVLGLLQCLSPKIDSASSISRSAQIWGQAQVYKMSRSGSRELEKIRAASFVSSYVSKRRRTIQVSLLREGRDLTGQPLIYLGFKRPNGS